MIGNGICYSCVHRRNLPGDAHSQCVVLEAKTGIKGGEMLAAMTMMHNGRVELDFITVVGSAHGVRAGWFMWPLNYDPMWLEQCTGHEPAKKLDAAS